MAKFQRKATVVEAVQWFKGGDHPAVRSLYGVCTMDQVGEINTPQGRVNVFSGDWIVTDAEGNLSAYRPAIFEAEFEPVEAPEKPAK